MSDKWNKRYAGEDYVYGRVCNDFLKEQTRSLNPGNVLCIADGEGRNSVYLATQGFRVTAVDSSVEGLRKANALAEEEGVPVNYVLADLGDFDLGIECWDNIVSIFCHLPKPLRERVHAACFRALKPGGVLLLEAYTPAQLDYGTGGPPSAELMPTLADLKSELHSLQELVGVERVRDVREGEGHDGKGSVVQFVARKPGIS